MNKQVQIILPVLNRLELTRQTIESLFDNTPVEKYNLFILDDGSEQETASYLENLALTNENVYVMRNKVPVGPGAARNELINYITDQKLRGEYLYSSDNDVYFKPEWLDRLILLYEEGNATLADHKLSLLGASCHPFLQNNTSMSFAMQEHLVTDTGEKVISLEKRIFTIGIKDAVSGYSQLMSWATWDEFGPFDEGSRGLEEKTGRSEDWALCQKIVKAGFLVGAVEPELIVPCGKTNTYGKPAVGQETFKEFKGVKVQ